MCVCVERERGLMCLLMCLPPLVKGMTGFTPTLPHTNTYLIEPSTIKLIRSQSLMSFPLYPQPLHPSLPLHRYLPASLPSLSPTCCNHSHCLCPSTDSLKLLELSFLMPLTPPLPSILLCSFAPSLCACPSFLLLHYYS